MACMEEVEYSYKIFIRTSERKRIFGSTRNRYENNNKIDLKEIRVCGYGLNSCSPVWEQIVVSCECSNKLLVFKKGEKCFH
jgi:hypothetical protein